MIISIIEEIILVIFYLLFLSHVNNKTIKFCKQFELENRPNLLVIGYYFWKLFYIFNY